MSSQAEPRVLISHKEIAVRINQLSSEISNAYRDKNPLLIGILKGSFMFMADLVRVLDFPLEVDFIGLSSYGEGKESSGKVRVTHRPGSEVRDRHVLVVEDIVDSGLTLAFLREYLLKKKPASVKLCALIDKPDRHQVPVTIDYLGFTVPNKFLVGYGLDWDEKYRNLPDICVLDG
ncbi:MAG: hypoxanthine phosphoribosyltransferase [Dehalococcoidales bacterium]|nr:MAG: hypoxanthine phosphoribosyltransferase [Dehalococcoidales bacterium]